MLMKEMKTDTLWEHLHWLTVLAEQGSFTRAAARLDVSKAAMSQKIKELEERAGLMLVQRTTRSVRLTSAGEKLVEELREPFARIEQSFFSVRDTAGPVRGLVRITAPVAFARQQLVPLIGEFLRDYPQVRLQLDVTDRLVSLSSEGFDLAIRHCDTLPETHVALPLCDTQTVLVASPAYLRAQGMPESPQALAQHNCLYYPRGVESPRWRFVAPGESETVQVQIQGSFAPTTVNRSAMRPCRVWALPCCPTSAPMRRCQRDRYSGCCRSGSRSALLPPACGSCDPGRHRCRARSPPLHTGYAPALTTEGSASPGERVCIISPIRLLRL